MVPCTRCGRAKALSDAELAKIQRVEGVPLVTGICVRCSFQDPVLRDKLLHFMDQRRAQLVTRVRAGLARPLEIIDEFVERFR